jgi:hypothetical protein
MLVLYAFVLCLAEDGNLSPKHVRDFMFMNNLLFYVNRVHLLVYVGDYSHNARNE